MTPEPNGADAATEAARLIFEACHEPWTHAWAELDARLASVVEPLRTGLARHREAIISVGLLEALPDEWAVRADKLLEYRRSVGSTLLEPLAAAMQEGSPSARITQLFDEALEEAGRRARTLPDDVSVPWPAGALAPHPADGLGRRLGKLVARAVSAARKAGEDRKLPLRSVGLMHLAEDVAEAQGEAVIAAMSAWADWGRRLERAWLEWADGALPALVQAELPDAEEAAALWARIGEAATGLQSRLEALADDVPHAAAAGEARAMLDACSHALEADLAVAGSFLLPGRPGPPARLEHVTKVAPTYLSWDREIAERMRLYQSILAIMAGATVVQRRVVQRCREGSLANAGSLLVVASELRELVPVRRERETSGRLEERVAALDSRVSRMLQPVFGAIPDPPEVAATLSEATDSAVEALLAIIRQAPSTLTLHDAERAPTPDGKRKVESRSMPLQELARQSFDALRIERIRSSTDGLLAAIGGVRDDLEGLPEVFSFSRDEALRELEESDETEAEREAVELLNGALGRMASALETRIEDLEKAIHGAHARLASEIAEGSTSLLGRVGAGRMQAQLLAARSRVADLFAWMSDAWGPYLRRAVAWTRAAVQRVSAWLEQLRAKVSSLLGREDASRLASSRSIQSLAEVQALVEGLPLVYQRLFTLEPISDAAMLTGRAGELESATLRWRRWLAGEGVPLLVRGRQRSGITSFMNVFGAQIEAEGRGRVAVTLDERIACDSELARLLAGKLDLAEVGSLDELARAMFSADKGSLPAAVTIDNLEHVYLRVPKGTDLAERLLTLMAETGSRIFWVAGISSSAWQLIATAEPTAVSQMDVMDLPPLSPEAMRAAILARHRRSGLDVRYEESVSTRARLRRRLRSLRDGKGFRKLVEDEFFDRLNRASGGYLGLALFLWLQSATFDPEEGVLMSLPRRPDFSILDRLSLTQNFTLKAFLEHRTLTLEEHDRIFRLPRHESYQIFESLRNRQLILEADQDEGHAREQSEIEVNLRYRLRSLLTGAVIAHLQARNIVH